MKKVIKNALWSLSLTCFLIVGLMSCDPRNVDNHILVVVNGCEEVICVSDNWSSDMNDGRSVILYPSERYEIYKEERFTEIQELSPFNDLIETLKYRNNIGIVELYSLDENLCKKERLNSWSTDDIRARHFFNEDSWNMTYFEREDTYEWTFTILPGDLVPEYSDNGAEQVRQ